MAALSLAAIRYRAITLSITIWSVVIASPYIERAFQGRFAPFGCRSCWTLGSIECCDSFCRRFS